MTERPTGLIFAFGVAIGMVVWYRDRLQVLSADVGRPHPRIRDLQGHGVPTGGLFSSASSWKRRLSSPPSAFWPGLAFSQLFYSRWPT